MNVMSRTWHRFLPRQKHKPATETLDGRTLTALATVIFLVQFPHVFHLPIWVSLTGATLVALKLWRHNRPDDALLRRLTSPVAATFIAAATAVLIRMDYGYSLGRDPCVAFLFVLIAAKYAELKRANDATALLCLSAFLLLTQYFYAQSILAAVLTLPAVFAFGVALAVLRDADNPATNTDHIKLVGKLLLQGLPLAAILFLGFPRLPGPLWSLPDDAVARTGLSDSMAPGSIGSLSQSNEVAFRVEFDGVPPTPEQLYWRGPVLSQFDGREWTEHDTRVEAHPQAPSDNTRVHDYTVMLQPHRQRWLFALDTAASLPYPDNPDTTAGITPRVLGQLMSDGQMIAERPVTQVLRYRQSSVLSDTLATNVPPAPHTLYLPGKNPRTIAFARSLREKTTGPWDYAQRVLNIFSENEFHYTLQPQLLGDAPVDEFLFQSQAGFCEHYSAAFVVLMRAAGIPARVVTGYLGGEMNGDYMIVRQSHAHAWAEAHIDGAWRRFDPTAHVSPLRVEQGLSAALPDEVTATGLTGTLDANWLREAQLRWDAMNHRWQTLVVNFNDASQEKLWEKLGVGTPSLMQIVVGFIALSAVWCALIIGLPSWQHKHLPPTERHWLQLCRVLARRGITRNTNESMSEFLNRAALAWPNQQARLTQLNTDFSALRFQRQYSAESDERLTRVRRELLQLAARAWPIGRRGPHSTQGLNKAQTAR